MARGPYWLCSEIKTIGRNLDKTDAEIAAMLPGRKAKAVENVRSKYRIWKPEFNRARNLQYPRNAQGPQGIQTGNEALNSQDIPE